MMLHQRRAFPKFMNAHENSLSFSRSTSLKQAEQELGEAPQTSWSAQMNGRPVIFSFFSTLLHSSTKENGFFVFMEKYSQLWRLLSFW